MQGLGGGGGGVAVAPLKFSDLNKLKKIKKKKFAENSHRYVYKKK